MNAPIAIVGIGCRFAGARNPQEFWRVTREGRANFGPVPPSRWDVDTFFDANPRARDKSYAPTGAWVDDVETFPAQTLQIPPRRVEVMDPQQRLALECAIEAVEDAGFGTDHLPHRTGVYLGVTATEYRTLSTARVVAGLMASGALGQGALTSEEAAVLSKAVDRVVSTRPYSAPGVLANMIAATVAQELRLHGPAFTTDAACASSLVALHAAVAALRLGQIDAALAGGVYLCLTPEHHIAFSRIGAISKAGVCRPFDARADGFVQGDGCGIVLLKRLEDAQRDGDRIYGLLHGIAMNNDGGGAGPMAPVKEGQVEVIRAAWEDAGVSPATLGYIESHGTGTLVGDHIEFDGLSEALGGSLSRAAIGSTKANFGHTMSAAGICGIIRAVLALHHEELPPMAGFETAKPDLPLQGSPLFIPKAAETWRGANRLACVSSFGFGGTNGHVVLGARPAAAKTIDTVSENGAHAPAPVLAERPELFVTSAPDEATLRSLAGATAASLRNDAHATLAGAVRAWNKRRRQPMRLAVVARTKDALIAALEGYATGDMPRGLFAGLAPETAPRIAFIYPGQGAQRVGMLAGIRDRFPLVADNLSTMDDAVAGVMARPISHYLYPERRPELAGRPLDLDALNAELTETDNCQPALFAVGFALTKLLGAVGVKPAVVAGHSVGEFTAAAVAGLTSPDEGIRWCARRGQGMQALGGDKGGMAAIVAEPSIVATVLAEGAVIANINHPRQVVISGFTEAVRKTVENARAKGLEVTELRVSHGFHSGVFAKLDLDSTVDAIAFSDGHVPVASCIDPATYTDSATARDVYKRHARSPVDWVGALQRCRDAGADLFLQIAAGGPLLSFVRGTLPGVPALTLASRDDTDHGASLLEGLGQLFVHGVDLDLDAITAHEPVASLPPSILPREHYWVVANRAVDAAPDFGRKLAVATESPAPARTVTETPPRSVTPAPAPAAAAPAAGVDPKVDIVFAAVAKASAYPRAALRATMKLGDDLGFDSMMVADFTEELRKQIPGFPGIPQDVLVNQPTIQSIVDYVLSPAASEAAPVAATTEDQAPLRAFRPVPTPSPLPLASLSRPLVPGRFHRSGPPANAASPSPGQLVAERLVALGWKEVCEVSAANPDKGLDLVIVDGFDAGPTPPVSAVLAGEAVAPADRIDALAAIMRGRFASSRQTAGFDLLHLHASDDVWAAGVAGFVRSVAREWPARVVRNISMTKGISSADALIDELRSHDRTVDLMYRPEGRAVVGLESTETASAWRPEPGEKVVITGGTRGIGFKLAQRLAEAGARVVVVGRTHPHGTVPPNIDVCLADLTDTAAIKATLGSHAGATTLIHAAGLLADGPLGQVGPEVAAAAWRVKVDGLLGSIAALGGSLVRVVAIGSWAGRFGNRHQAFYGAANAQMAALVAALPERFAASVAEFGPWTDSDMVRSIPPAIQAAMRADGVDFVADEAGLLALMQDLGQRGVIVHGRRLTTDLHLGERSETLDVATHTFLKDHAIAGVPVFPLASATTFLAETAAVAEPFEINDLRLFQGIQVTTPRVIEARVRGARAELFQRAPEAGATPVLSYQATIQRAPTTSTLPPAAPIGGEAPSLPLAAFYGGITFHGPLLQGITAIEAVGRDFVRGRVRTSRPANWIQGSAASAWAVDPLAFDAAMQLAAYVAWVRWSRAGTPIGFDRFVQLERWPEGEVRVDARFEDREADTLSANIVFRSADGARVIAFAEGVRADMRKVERQVVEKAAPAPTPAAKPFEVKAEWVDPAKFKGYKDISMRLQAVKAMGLKNPYFDLHEGTARNTSVIAGHEVINYSSYNYLGLSGDPRVIAEVEAAIRKYGTSVSASRVASGERPFHRDLEAALARAHGCEDALVMAGGHATNVNTIGHLFNSKDLILHDELIHDSCLQGIKLSGAARRSFRHEDIAHLEQQLEELRPHYEKVLILVEGVYSMDGDITNLPEYIRLKRKHGCLLMVDEAHSFGTIGATGCGVGEHFGLDEVPPRDGLNRKDVDIWMGTMSKSLASMGGWVAGRKELILYLRYTTPGFVFAAGIPPALGQAALSSLNYMLAEPWRVRNLQHNSKRFWQLLHERGLDTGPSHGDSPVIPVITGDSMWALKLSERLLEQGINAKPIIFPAVANDAARLRFFMTSLHTEEQLVYTADTIQQTLAAIRAESNQPKKR